MKQTKNELEQSSKAELSEIEACFENEASTNVASYLDHSILLAAEREITQPASKRSYQISWFRKLSLPLYAATSMAFTLFAINYLWQPPQYSLATKEKHNVEVDFSQSIQSEAPTVPVNKRVEREMPQMIVPPSDSLILSDSAGSEALSEKSNPVIESTEAIQSIFTGYQMSVKNYSEKQAWVEKIVNYMKNGQLQLARDEIVAFKKIYPEYPIEEQIKLFLP
ncbi:MAG: hypothetical protein Q9M92_00290 [Enterobacterales bacterium]|nr:hypothetical protein [Enterobacterales bacterium]